MDGRPEARRNHGAPYLSTDDDRAEVDRWLEADPRLAVAYGDTGWYGNNTLQITLWRTDLIEVIESA